MTTVTPGIYRHYKGYFYRVIGVGKHSETLDDLVFYEALYHNPRATLWVRPLAMFRQLVSVNGKRIPRFARQQPRRQATLCFLVKQSAGQITNMCLAMKKRGFGAGRWNGAGGKVWPNETIEQAMKREVAEEINVSVTSFRKVADLTFFFTTDAYLHQRVHVYLASRWQGKPAESEEMKPRWFAVEQLPYDTMWPDDIFWLPIVLAGKHVTAWFVFSRGDSIIAKQVSIPEQVKLRH